MTEPVPWLDRLFAASEAADLEKPTPAQLQELEESPGAQRHFDTLCLAERVLHGTPAERSPLERQVARWRMELALDQMLATEHPPAPRVLPLWMWRPRSGWLLAAAALCVSVLGAGLMWQGLRGGGEEEFRSRSGSPVEVGMSGAQAAPKLLVYCGVETPQGFRFSGQEEAAFDTVRCPLSGEVKFALSHLPHGHTHLSLVGISLQSRRLLWYGPSPAMPTSLALAAGSHAGPVAAGESIRLPINHTPGVVEVWGIVSKSPVTFDTLRRHIDPDHVDANALSARFDAVIVHAEFEVIPDPLTQETP